MKTETPSRIKILLSLTGGGFFWEARSLAGTLGEGYELHYVTTPDAPVTAGANLLKGEVHTISRVTTMSDNTSWKIARNVLASFRDAFRLVRDISPDAVVCVGSSIAVPLCLAAKLQGRKAVFVESITRVSKPSLTGKILSTLRLCDRFYVQWPEAEKLYRGAVYRGTVL